MNRTAEIKNQEPRIKESSRPIYSDLYQGGFTLVGTVFLITVLATVGAFLVTLVGTEQAAALYSLQGARAYAAAQSGIEWAARQALVAASCAASTTITSASGAPNNFTITVTCSASPGITEGGGTPYNVYTLTSTATTGSAATADLISRQVQASVTNG